ncbi:type IX secretion system periplasmic lipoprotein PorW/SprE [Porphyromonas loveana]|uniref:type IX secretion system periplasmic lipoprotein PorW/SprE n=2 Tax=Porphyromonas loveana TaxID=1884669 RepID=UPI0035A1BD0D
MRNHSSLYPLLSRLAILTAAALGILSCSTSKNTAGSRFYHNFTTRYNVFYNGDKAYNDAYVGMLQNHTEGYSEEIFLDPITAQSGQEKAKTGGAFDGAIIKGRKAIQLHSIRTKPERKQGWQNDPKAVAFQNKREYNTFLHNAWMLVGKSQFYNADFLQAQATFSYIARLYSNEPAIRDEARLWQVRCYSEMGWLHEGQRLLERIPKDQPHTVRRGLYSKAVAERFILAGEKSAAIPYLRQAAAKEKNRHQRARMYYLLGQLLQDEERQDEARKAYTKVLGATPPFALDFAARLRKMELDSKKNPRSVANQLERMAKRSKYQDVQDQIFFSAGNIFMSIPDTTSAIKSFLAGIEKSTTRGTDYALCQIRLGDIYMQRRQYLLAQPCFSAAAGTLNRLNPDYKRVTELSSQLDELVGHARIVHDQDSLLTLAAMPEEQRLAVIDSVIKAYIEAEKKLKDEEEIEKLIQNQEAFNAESDGLINHPTQNQGMPQAPQQTGSGEFYFYNPLLIAQGKTAFERKWGKRVLEDDWRRRRKQANFDTPTDENTAAEEGEEAQTGALMTEEELQAAAADSAASDPRNRAYYLAQLPMTEDAKEAAGKLIAEGLFGMGTVFNERMEKFDESAVTYETLLRRYPNYEKRMDVLYRLFMLYTRMNMHREAERCRSLILQHYPQDNLAKALSNPNYLQELATMDRRQNQLYDEAFEAYLRGAVQTVRRNRNECRERFPLSELAPQFDFLNALCYVLEGDAKGFSDALKALVKDYPKAEVTELASSMLAELLRGRSIVQGGYSGINWDFQWGGAEADSISPDSLPPFVKPRTFERTRLILLAPSGTLNQNRVLFALASFNFSRFTEHTLEITQSTVGGFDQWLMSSLPNTRLGWQYIKDAFSPEGFMSAMGENSLLFPISETNYQLLIQGKGIGQYMAFLAQEEVPETAFVLDRWQQISGRAQAAGKEDEDEVKSGSPVIEEEELPEPAIDRPDSTTPATSRPITPVKQQHDSLQVAAPITFDIDREQITSSATPATADTTATDTIAAKADLPSLRQQEGKGVSAEQIQRLAKDRAQNEKDEKKALEKAKREKERDRKRELKKREQEREKARREKLKEQRQKQKEREEKLKQKERERKEKLRQREQERKAKEKERKQRLKDGQNKTNSNKIGRT